MNIGIGPTVDTVKDIVHTKATSHINTFLQIVSNVEFKPVRFFGSEDNIQKFNDPKNNLKKTAKSYTTDMVSKIPLN